MEAVLLLLVAQAAPVAREVAHLTMPRRLVTTRPVDATSGMILLCENGRRLEQRLNHQIPVIPGRKPVTTDRMGTSVCKTPG
jgi:hypothetical protein